MSPDQSGVPLSEADFRLGDWVVQPTLCRLVSGATVVRIRPKLMDVLSYLVGRAGRVVPKAEIIDAVWAKEYVAEGTLAQSVFELRSALGDDGKGSRYIETVPKRGYRLVASVQWLDATPARAPACVLVVGEREVALEPGVTVIGRAPDATVRIDLFEVSRHHSRIRVHPGGATLEDLGSKNGTYLRGERLTGPAELHDGDEVRVGGVLLVFRELGVGSTVTHER